MGLDAVELIIKIEERFKTQIPDKQAEKIQTVGELYNLLIRRIYQLNSTSCLTASTFYSIRKILLDQYCLTRQDVKPDSLLDDLITQDKRYDFWQTTQKILLVDLPRLKNSKMLQWKGDLFSEQVLTMKDLVYECARCNSITDEFKLDNSQLVWQEVCQIVADVAYVELEELLPETSFAKDLGF